MPSRLTSSESKGELKINYQTNQIASKMKEIVVVLFSYSKMVKPLMKKFLNLNTGVTLTLSISIHQVKISHPKLLCRQLQFISTNLERITVPQS